jgi:hypothetical protein
VRQPPDSLARHPARARQERRPMQACEPTLGSSQSCRSRVPAEAARSLRLELALALVSAVPV